MQISEISSILLVLVDSYQFHWQPQRQPGLHGPHGKQLDFSWLMSQSLAGSVPKQRDLAAVDHPLGEHPW